MCYRFFQKEQYTTRHSQRGSANARLDSNNWEHRGLWCNLLVTRKQEMMVPHRRKADRNDMESSACISTFSNSETRICMCLKGWSKWLEIECSEGVGWSLSQWTPSVAVLHIVVQCVAVCDRLLQRQRCFGYQNPREVLVACCSVSQRVAACCSVLQYHRWCGYQKPRDLLSGGFD